MAEDFKLELEHESTFKKKNPSLSQAELEAKYTDLWIKHKATAKGSDRSKWESFQKKNGVLLSADTSPTKWGDGKPLFKVRFTKSNQITTSVSSSAQVRTWRTKFLTEGSPGTKLALKDTGKQFYDSKTGHALQIHHEKGISEYGPFIDESIKKLIPGNDTKTLKTGLKEYKTFKKWAFQTGRIFGDKTENYTALLRNQHINIPGSVHWLRSPEGPFYSVKATGGPAFDSPNPSLSPLAQRTQKQKLTAQTGVSATPTQDLLNKANRTTFTKNYDITKPGSIWDQMGEWDDLTSQSTKDATALARQIANPTNEANKIAKVAESRITSTNLKDQIPVIKKIAAQYQINEGLDQIDAINKAKIEYNRIRYGDTLARGFDTRKLGLLKEYTADIVEKSGKVLKPIKPLVKKGTKYVLPVAGSVLANMNRSAISAEYEENPTNINLARKTVAQVQEGIEYVDTATLGTTGIFTWIPNLMGDAAEYILRTVQTPQTKEESDKEIDQLGDKFYTF